MSDNDVKYTCDTCEEVGLCQFAYDDYNIIKPGTEPDDNKCLLDDFAKVMSGKF